MTTKIEIMAERVASPVCGTLYRGTRLSVANWEAERLCRIGAARVATDDTLDEYETTKAARAADVGSPNSDGLGKHTRVDRMVRGSTVR